MSNLFRRCFVPNNIINITPTISGLNSPLFKPSRYFNTKNHNNFISWSPTTNNQLPNNTSLAYSIPRPFHSQAVADHTRPQPRISERNMLFFSYYAVIFSVVYFGYDLVSEQQREFAQLRFELHKTQQQLQQIQNTLLMERLNINDNNTNNIITPSSTNNVQPQQQETLSRSTTSHSVPHDEICGIGLVETQSQPPTSPSPAKTIRITTTTSKPL